MFEIEFVGGYHDGRIEKVAKTNPTKTLTISQKMSTNDLTGEIKSLVSSYKLDRKTEGVNGFPRIIYIIDAEIIETSLMQDLIKNTRHLPEGL